MMIDYVIQAQSGDADAFDRLVRQFQDLAVGYALGILGDPQMAQDVAQDSFLEAHAKLSQLRAPAAFPSWFKRIVFKHCDRRTRKKMAAGPEISGGESMEMQVDRQQARRAVWAAVEALPDPERLVVALHYFGEVPQKTVADFLELPLSTVKKRLHSARRRLQDQGRVQMQTFRPSSTPVFADRIAVFLAMQSGRSDLAKPIFERHPDWIDAPENWSEAEALDGGFTLSHRRTPLLLAAARGDLALIDYLLSAGADPNGKCGCDAEESPLFRAVAGDQPEATLRLIAAGADPDQANQAGFAPLHVASMPGSSKP